MNQLDNRVQITEIKGYQNVMFVLENDKDFSMTQYKVLQNNAGRSYLPCVKSLFNGKVKLVYFTNQKKTLKGLLPTLRSKDLIEIINGILQTLIDTKNNGFLNCMNVELDSSKVYIDSDSMTTELVYLPVDIAETAFADFERKLNLFIAEVFSSAPRLPQAMTVSICETLLEENCSLETVKGLIETMYAAVKTPDNFSGNSDIKPDHENEVMETLQLSCMDFGTKCVFDINQGEFIIGKKADSVDGHVAFNAAISRIHCKIVKMEESFYIIDLKSANGTFLNDERIEPQKAYRISNGDIVRLANSDFEVSIK